MPEQKTKQPREELDFDFDAFKRLTPEETLISNPLPVVTVEGTDSALEIPKISVIDTRIKVWTKGGTNGGIYKITCVAKTSGGRTIEREFLLIVRDQ